MLGIKLGPEVEARLERFVRRQGRRKSDIGRAAIIEYMDRHEGEDDFERDLRLVAEFERTNPEARKELKELDEMAWRMIRRND